ncbi:MAG: FliH/SctL family protein [Phycisphaerae bacterium]|nr:FliH/SctL family protein [Phycisphaerae bacterium]
MALLTGNQARVAEGRAVVLELGDLRREADRIIADARHEAEAIGRHARAEADRLRSEAEQRGREAGVETGHREGLAAGREEGLNQARAEAGESLARLEEAWTTALSGWEQQRQSLMLDAEETLLALAVQMATKLVHRVIEVDPATAAAQVSSAIADVMRPGDLVIHVHADDRPVVEDALPGILAKLGRCGHARLVEDPGIESGGCRVECGHGTVDATIETQLRRLAEVLVPSASAPDSSPQPSPPETLPGEAS